MSRQAVLPSGEVLTFADETPDDHIHHAVRQKMGLPPPIPKPATPEELAQQNAMAIIGAAQQSAQQLGQQITQAAQAFGGAVTAMNRLAQTVAAASEQLMQSVQAVHQASDANAHSLAATAEFTARAAQHAAGSHAELARKVDGLSAAVKAPRRAVKEKNGEWCSYPSNEADDG